MIICDYYKIITRLLQDYSWLLKDYCKIITRLLQDYYRIIQDYYKIIQDYYKILHDYYKIIHDYSWLFRRSNNFVNSHIQRQMSFDFMTRS